MRKISIFFKKSLFLVDEIGYIIQQRTIMILGVLSFRVIHMLPSLFLPNAFLRGEDV